MEKRNRERHSRGHDGQRRQRPGVALQVLERGQCSGQDRGCHQQPAAGRRSDARAQAGASTVGQAPQLGSGQAIQPPGQCLVDVARRSRPVANREKIVAEARDAIRANADEPSESKRLEHLKKLVARVGYLRMTTRKGGRHKREAGTFVVREGKLVEGGAEREKRVADGTISMQEAHDLHNRLMKRQYFGQTPPPQCPML